MSSTSPPTPPAPCISAIAAARWSATRWPTCSPRPATRSRKEYYVNDAGAQVSALAWAAYWRYLQALGTTLTRGGIRRRRAGRPAIPRRLPGSRRRGAGRRAGRRARRAGRHDRAARLWLDTVRDSTIARCSPASARTWRQLGVAHDVFTSRARPARQRRYRNAHRHAARKGPDLRGRARTAQGQDAGRLGAARANAVPRHAIRRRRRPRRCANPMAATRISPTTSPTTPTRSARGAQ